MSDIVRDVKKNLLKALEIIDQIESGEKDICRLSAVDIIMKVNVQMLKIAGYVEKPQRGRPKSESAAMTGAERVRKHRQKKSSL